jgi:hypothetical protein
MKWFSYDPAVGFDTHDTEQEAKASAEESLQEYRDHAGDGWDDDVNHVCWGQVREVSAMTEERIAPEGSEFDFTCDYVLREVE